MTDLRIQDAAVLLRSAIRELVADPRKSRSAPEDWRRAFCDLPEHYLDFQRPRLRLSYGSDCLRRLWYADKHPDAAEETDGASRYMFLGGFLWEAIVFQLLHRHPMAGRLMLGSPKWYQKPVQVDGIDGSLDHVLCLDGKPWAVLDAKETNIWGHKKWPEDGRRPHDMWGYPYQAALYCQGMRDMGHNIEGFIWLVRVVTKPKQAEYETAWMTWDELKPYADKARANFALIQRLDRDERSAPSRLPDRYSAPCGYRDKHYCPFWDTCWKEIEE